MRQFKNQPKTPKEIERRLEFLAWLEPTIGALRESYKGMNEIERVIFMNALIMNLNGPIPKADFVSLMATAAEPCGRPDCDCHAQTAELFNVIEGMRETWRAGTGKEREE